MDVIQHPPEVVDLLSDDDDLDDYEDQLDILDFPDDYDDHGEEPVSPFDFGQRLERAFIDLTVPERRCDGDAQSGHARAIAPARAGPARIAPINADAGSSRGELVTEAACLQMIVEVLPDISVGHVLQIIAEQTQDRTRTPEVCQRIIDQILEDGAYPRAEEEEEVGRKRKRERSLSVFEEDNGQDKPAQYNTDALNLLKDEFVNVPVRHINTVFNEHKTFFKSYGIIDDQLRNYGSAPFIRINKPRLKKGVDLIFFQRESEVLKELQAAQSKSQKEAAKRQKAEEHQEQEEANFQMAVMAGEMGECKCCFDDFPLNRMIGCGGDTVHSFCRECVKNYVESEMGNSRCQSHCFADSSCHGPFTRQQLQTCLSKKTFDRLEHMQQQQELERAGLDLDECPFCPFRQECPPVEVDKEFRCLDPKCRKTSCRLCQKLTHIPLNCEEAKKDEKITVRHIVEEAMTQALIRNCNKCKHRFIKEYGCNKMRCSHCNNVQCYVCSKDITNYEHFSDHRSRTGCPLHDNVEDRHEQEVKKAAAEAMAKVRAENPGVSETDLMVEVSDRVKRGEQQRLRQAQEAHQGFGYHMHNGALVHAAAPAPAAPAQQYVPPAPNPAFVPLQNMPQHLFGFQRYYPNPQAAANPPPAANANGIFVPLQPFQQPQQVQQQQQQQQVHHHLAHHGRHLFPHHQVQPHFHHYHAQHRHRPPNNQ